MFLRTAYNYDVDAVSLDTALVCLDVSRTKQSFAEESDINTIVRRFGLSGEMPSAVAMPQYGDFTAVQDYHSALNVITAANEGFDALPAEVRSRFTNDPANLLAFLADDANRPEAEKLGLVVVPAVLPAVDPVVVPAA